MVAERKLSTEKGKSTMKRRGKITQVRSGIGLMSMAEEKQETNQHSIPKPHLPSIIPPITTTIEVANSEGKNVVQSFLTSRTARVLLAGAGFLADAVRIPFSLCFLSKAS